MNTYTPTGAVQKISDTVWAVPTATGLKYFTPSIDAQGVDGIESMPLRAGGGGNSTQIPWEVVQQGDFGRYGGTALGFDRENRPGPDGITGHTGWFFDQNPGQATYNYDEGGSFFGDVLGNFVSGPGVPLGGFIGAGAFGSGGLGNFLNSFGGGAGGVSGGAMFDPFVDFGGDYWSGLSDFMGGSDAVIPSSYGANGWPTTGIYQNGLPMQNPFNSSPILWNDGSQTVMNGLFGGGANSMASKLLGAVGGGGTGGGSALGAGIGALLGALGANGKPAGTTTTVQDIPEWLKPYVVGNLVGATDKRNSLTSDTSLMDAAKPEYLKTIRGDYLNPASNPYLDQTFKHAAGLMGANIDSRFSAAGRYGSGAHQGVLQEGMGNLANQIYGGNYQAERARQNAAVTSAPAYTSGTSAATFAPYVDYSRLFPNVRATSEPYFTNTMGGILSGAGAGSQLGKALGF